VRAFFKLITHHGIRDNAVKNEKVNQIVFRETQTVKSKWIWGLVLIPLVVVVYGMVQQLIFNIPWGSNPMSDAGLFITGLVVIIGLPLFIYFVRLEIQIRKDGIYYRYAPFHFRFQRIPIQNLAGYQVVHYRPLHDYGGWGIRYGKYGKAYTLSGNVGLQVVTTDQKKLMLGTHRPDELKKTLNSLKGEINGE